MTAVTDVSDARSDAGHAGRGAVRLRAEFRDVGAIVYILRKCVWWVPGFTVERYRDTLHRLHRQITSDGAFVAHSSRFLIEARRPSR